MDVDPADETSRSRGQHAHTDEWGRFEIHAQDFRAASRLAAELGWWLHCWVWVGGPDAPSEPRIVDLYARGAGN